MLASLAQSSHAAVLVSAPARAGYPTFSGRTLYCDIRNIGSGAGQVTIEILDYPGNVISSFGPLSLAPFEATAFSDGGTGDGVSCRFVVSGSGKKWRGVAVYDNGSRAIHVCDVATGRLIRAAGGWVPAFPSGLGLAPDGGRLVVASEGRVRLGDLATGRLLRELPMTDPGGLAADGHPDPPLERWLADLAAYPLVLDRAVRRLDPAPLLHYLTGICRTVRSLHPPGTAGWEAVHPSWRQAAAPAGRVAEHAASILNLAFSSRSRTHVGAEA